MTIVRHPQAFICTNREPSAPFYVIWGEDLLMQTRRPLALIPAFFITFSLSAADPQLVNMVMPDAKVVAGINVDSARNSPFGTFLLRQASGNNAELQKFVEF